MRIAISDTITDIDTLDNYIRVTKTIRDTLYIQGNTTYIAKSRTEVRQEQKTERKKIKEENKTQRKQIKQDSRTRRNRAFYWLVTGICVFFGVVLFLISKGPLEPK